jgi:hypothetical protein
MSKVTVKPSIAASAGAATATITKSADAQVIMAGAMQVSLQKPGVLSHYRIVEVVGESAKNQVYMSMVMPLLWITEIDGAPQMAPTTKRELEALIQRLGDDGVNAIMAHVYKDSAAAAASGDSVKN